MSSHGHTHSSFFSSPKSWLATAHTGERNILSATDVIGHELVDATVKTTTWYIANILNPLSTAMRNLWAIVSPSAYHNHGLKTPFKGTWWAISNTAKACANIFTGIPHGVNNAVKHGVNNAVVEASNGTLDRIPFVGKFLWNIPKFAAWAVNAPFHFASWITKKIPDRFMDWLAKPGIYQAPGRHLIWANSWSAHEHGWWHH